MRTCFHTIHNLVISPVHAMCDPTTRRRVHVSQTAEILTSKTIVVKKWEKKNSRKTFEEGAAFTLRKNLFGPSQYLYLLSNTRVRFDNVYRRRLRNKRKFKVEKNRSTYVLYTITRSPDATSIGHFTRARPCGSHRLRRRCHNRFLVPVDRSRSLVASLPLPPGAVYARFVQRCKRPLQSCPD